MKTFKIWILIISLIAFAIPALAKPVLKVDLKTETKIMTMVDGQEVQKTVPIDEVNSGQTIVYTLTVTNSGDQPATDVKLDDPIPEGTTYVVGSIFGDEADTTFSIDGGKTYKKPTLLSYRIKKADGTTEEKLASPDQYTNIKWLIKSVPAGSSRSVGFKALVK
jgi:uncharacterized repeat protein (TIGR01451 family)